jgi:nucleoside-diphosphate-sugar epimerase
MTGRRTVLVTGASGRIGRPLCRRLVASGWRVRALVHERRPEGVHELVPGALDDPASLDAAVDGVDAIVHLAGVTHARSVQAYDAGNAVGTTHLVDAVMSAGGAPLIHVSTRAIQGDSGYSRSKRRAEEAVAARLANATIVRLPEVYGCGGLEGADRIINSALRNEAVVVVNGPYELRPVFVDDTVDALAAALENADCRGRTYTLAGSERFTMRSLAAACVAILRSRSRVIPVPPALVAALAVSARFLPLPLYPDQLERLASAKPEPSEEAATDLAFRPRRLRDGLLGAASARAAD